MTPHQPWHDVARLSLPLAAQQLGQQAMGVVDVAVLGHYDATALAGAGVANALLFGVQCVGIGCVLGLDATLPRALGEGQPGAGRRYWHDGMRVALGAGVVTMLFLALATPHIWRWASIEQEVADQASAYTYLRAFGVIPSFAFISARSVLAAHRRARGLFGITLAANVLNLLLDWLLVFGAPSVGLPALGLAGAALATVAVQLLQWAAARTVVATVLCDEPVASALPPQWRAVLRYGFPVGMQMFAETLLFALGGLWIASFGKLAAGAHNAALAAASLTFNAAIGIASATAAEVGRARGEQRSGAALRRIGIAGFGLGALFMTTSGLLFISFPASVMQAFTSDPAVIAAGVPLVRIAAAFQIFDGLQVIASGALRGLGRTTDAWIANALGYFVLGIPSAYWFGFALGAKASGIWWGFTIGLAATALLGASRFVALTRRWDYTS